jgi:hypothetical protein
VDDLANASTRFGSEKDFLDYHRGFTRNQLIGVDDERLKAGLIFMDASRNLGHTSPAQQRLRARRKTTENPPERKGEQGDWVWGLNNVFRAVQLRRDRMAGEQPASTSSTGGSLAVQSGGGAAARPPATTSKPGGIAATLRQSIETMKAADAKQFGMLAQQLFESSWKLERTSRYRGKTKEQAMESFKQDLAAKMQQGMAQRATTPTPAPAGGKGSVAAALKASLEALKASDKRLEQLTEDVIDLRIQAEEFGDDEPTGGAITGQRRRRSLPPTPRRR